MQGKKTHEQQKRMFERKPDISSEPAPPPTDERRTGGKTDPRFRETEFPVSRGGLNQEDRRHNKPDPDKQPKGA